ncbi:hypothetical protein [Nocardioides sp.]|uniref:hypothetical protein n=1 Tax=Nocardioides sp. TaxID=35761 RepID=UPI0035199BAB
MPSTSRDPHDLPDDAAPGVLAAYVGEDVGRQLMVRLCLGVAALGLLAGAFSEASDAARTAVAVVSGLGIVLLATAGLARWSRPRQWLAIAAVLVTTTPLVALVLAQHRDA